MPTFPNYNTGYVGYTEYNVEQFSKVVVKVLAMGRGTSATFGRLWYIADGNAIALMNAQYHDTVPSDLANGVEIDLSNISSLMFLVTTNNHCVMVTEWEFFY